MAITGPFRLTPRRRLVPAVRSDRTLRLRFCWDDISNLSAETGKVALSLAGPHALLSYFSILASMGKPADPDCEILIDEQGEEILMS